MSGSKPTLVLIHGSWHSPQHFRPLVKVLDQRGYKTVTVSLPSTQSPQLPPATLFDDTKAVRHAITAELASSDVVVVAHSYGGTPTNNGLQGLDARSRSAEGKSTAVRSIAFLCAIPLPAGVSFIDALGGKPHPIHDLRTPEFTWVAEPGPSYYFYNDLSPADQKQYSDMLRPQSWAALCSETTYAAYMEIPCRYLYCMNDQAFLPEAQQALVEAAIQAGARIKTETIESSHSPFLSMPEKTAEFIIRAAEAGAQ